MHCHWLTRLPCWLRCEQSHWFKSGSGAKKRSNAQEESHDAEAEVEQVLREFRKVSLLHASRKNAKKQLQEARHHMSRRQNKQTMTQVQFKEWMSYTLLWQALTCFRVQETAPSHARPCEAREKRKKRSQQCTASDMDASAGKYDLLRASSAMMLMIGCGLSQESFKQDHADEAVKQSELWQARPSSSKHRRCARLIHIHDKLSW